MLDLTIAIPVKNEAHQIAECINQIGNDFAKYIDVIDSNSTDDTAEIAKELGANVIQFNWDGKYPKKRNWYLFNYTPKSKWVLFLDADELLTENFKRKIKEILPLTQHKGFWLNYSIYMNDYKLKAGYPLKKLALFQTNFGFYEKIEEENWSKLDMEIHEHPIVNGSLGLISEKIEHNVNFDHVNWKQKHIEYAKWEAKRFSKLKYTNGNKHLTLFQKIKYTILKTPFAGVIFFIGSFVFMLGFIDGLKGLKYNWLKAFYFNRVSTEIKQLNFR
jgi:glycosyltransferase involved in cell wall biosynthesis